MLYYLKALFVIVFILVTVNVKSQGILFNAEGGKPDSSAIMELRSSSQGFLVPRMDEVQRLAISSPAQGLLVFQTSGLNGFYYFNGANWDTLDGSNTINYISNVTNITNSGITLIKDVKASNVDGGTFTSGAWQKRDLNTINGDVTNISLLNDTIRIDSGIYAISISAPAFSVDNHQVRLFNISTNTVEASGTMCYSNLFASSSSLLSAIVVVGSNTEKFVVQQRCSSTRTIDGFGKGSSWAENVYTQVKIQKL